MKTNNVFSIDLEEWFCSHNLINSIKQKDWLNQEERVIDATLYLLDLLDRYQTKGTFFVLGWIAMRHPDLIQELHRKGHEIASHGFGHQQLTTLNPQSFAVDLLRSVESIERACGVVPSGYRAPAFSLVQQTKWAIDILKAQGFSYDSSVYPLSLHPDYGMRDAPLGIYRHENELLEIPLSCCEIAGYRFPCSGGAYFRIFPYAFFKQLINRLHKQGRPLIFYLHPWELDADIPKIKLSRSKAFRHYYNLDSVKGKLEKLFEDFQFISMQQYLED